MAEKIITASDLVKREGFSSIRERITERAKAAGFSFRGEKTAGIAVKARINQGRWIADCECGGAEYVDTADPIFFCLSCGNRATHGRARPVEFPQNMEEIEADMLSRKVIISAGRDEIERQLLAKPAGKPRNWTPEG